MANKVADTLSCSFEEKGEWSRDQCNINILARLKKGLRKKSTMARSCRKLFRNDNQSGIQWELQTGKWKVALQREVSFVYFVGMDS